MTNPFIVSSRVRYNRNNWLHIKRQLPASNMKINVSLKQELQPEDVLGEGQTTIGYRVIHLAKELGTNPKTAFTCLRRKIGQNIYKGELIAQYRSRLGFNNKIYISKVDGTLEDLNPQTGDIRIRLIPKNTQVMSGVFGIVEDINTKTGVITIKTVASVIYGVLGTGKEREGIIQVLGGADDLISSRQIPQEMRGKILVGGGLIFSEALEAARSSEATGIVTGGINASDYRAMIGDKWNIKTKQWTDVGLSLIVTEGFGDCAIGEDIMTLLKEHNNKFAIIDGYKGRLILPSQDRNCMMYLRRVHLPSESVLEDLQQQIVELKVGCDVRITAAPYIGVQGKVIAIDQAATRLNSGMIARLITVDTKSRKMKMPYSNVEVLR